MKTKFLKPIYIGRLSFAVLVGFILANCTSSLNTPLAHPLSSPSEPGSPTQTLKQVTPTPISHIPSASLDVLEPIPPVDFDVYGNLFAYHPGITSQKIAASQDGKYILSAGDAESYAINILGGIFVWDAQNLGLSITSLTGNVQRPESVAFSKDGKKIAVGGCGGEEGNDPFCVKSKIILFDWQTGILESSFEWEEDVVIQMEFAMNDMYLLAQGVDNHLTVLDLNNNQIIQTLDATASGANSFAVIPDGNRIVTGDVNGIKIIDMATFQTMEMRDEPQGGIGYGPAISISPNGEWLAASGCGEWNFESCSSGEIYIWNNENPEPERIILAHASRIMALEFSPQSNILAASGEDGLSLWNVVTGAKISSEHSSQNMLVYDIVFYPDGKKFMVVTNVGIVLGEIAPDYSTWSYKSLYKFGHQRKYYISPEGNNLNLRSGSSLNDPILKELEAGEIITVIEGPQEADGYIWWWVITENGDDGWVVENRDWYIAIP